MQVTLNTEILKDSRIPRKFWKLNPKTYMGSRRALKVARNYVANFETAIDSSSGVGLFLIGKPVSYKTFLATLVLKSLLAKGYDIAYWTLETLHNERFKKDVSFEALVTRDHCIVIDNANLTYMGQTGGSVFLGTFRRAIQMRSDNALPYIVCTQLDMEIFEAHYGPEIVNRLKTDLVRVDCEAAANVTNWENQVNERKAPFRLGYA